MVPSEASTLPRLCQFKESIEVPGDCCWLIGTVVVVPPVEMVNGAVGGTIEERHPGAIDGVVARRESVEAPNGLVRALPSGVAEHLALIGQRVAVLHPTADALKSGRRIIDRQ